MQQSPIPLSRESGGTVKRIIRTKFKILIQEINEKGPVFQKTILVEDDRIVGSEEDLKQVETNSVIISINQMPRKKLMRTIASLEANEWGCLVVDENYMATRPDMFVAGNVVSGVKTVVYTVEAAKMPHRP